MLTRHVSRWLSIYHTGELDPAKSRRVAVHLQRCPRCREEYDAIRSAITLVRNLPRASAPERLWDRIEAQMQSRTADAQRSARPRSARLWAVVPIVTSVLTAVALLIVAGVMRQAHPRRTVDSRPFWNVARLNGAPTIDADRIGKTGRLKVGEWLETDDRSRARLEAPDIGSVEVEPNSRLRLLTAQAREHRLSLARGTLHAKVTAPPRLFFVETPSAVAVDLGCAYTLTVDRSGGSLLSVTLGYVALERKGHEVTVPAGAACETRPGLGPGTPFFTDTSTEFRAALEQLDFASGGADALSAVLARTRERDTLTLWYLLPRVEGPDRERVYRRLAALVPPPAGVSRENILRLDPATLDQWREEVEPLWWE